MAWYPGKKIVEGAKKLKKRRKKRISENKWVLGEKLTKAGRKRGTARQAGKRLGKAGIKVTAKEARLSGKIRKGAQPLKKDKFPYKRGQAPGTGSVKTDKAGVFPAYKKKSKAAGDFRAAFKKNCAGKGAGDTFSWDGRSYSCARASDKKKTTMGPKNKPAA